jgi:catechol 2,3-dioxygenase-like lactoylglutathione lyase family enzyme
MTASNEFVASAAEPTPVAETGSLVVERPAVALRAVNHIAVRVSDLPKAEAFYTAVFGMRLVGRAYRDSRGGYTAVEEGYDPIVARRQEREADVAFLESDALTFALRRMGRGDRIETNAVLDHISVDVDARGFGALRALVLTRNYDVLMVAAQAFTFRDPFGVVWEVTLEEVAPVTS